MCIRDSEKLIVDQIQFDGAKGLMGAQDLMDSDQERNYLIPDVLPHPSVVLIYGAGGDGKSISAWRAPRLTLAFIA